VVYTMEWSITDLFDNLANGCLLQHVADWFEAADEMGVAISK
jgi:hypothetical protein